MSVRIGHASIDEKGRITGGVAGDQNEREVCIRGWYSNSWKYVLRCRDSAIAEKMAKACEDACANDNIGYDQYQRTTLYKRAVETEHRLADIKTPCECDCSSLMCECAIAAGVSISPSLTTSTMKDAFYATGLFDILTDSAHISQTSVLKRGDILIRPGCHTAMVLDDGKEDGTKPVIRPAGSFNRLYAGRYKVTAGTLNVRCGPGTEYKVLSSLKQGSTVYCFGYYDSEWLYIADKTYGSAWVSLRWLEKTT